jgi:uncharacterized protein YjbJ (UPF0337 family)
MNGNTDKFNGKAKQVAGKVTDNKELQLQGKVQEAKGRLKVAGEKFTDKVDNAIEQPEE